MRILGLGVVGAVLIAVLLSAPVAAHGWPYSLFESHDTAHEDSAVTDSPEPQVNSAEDIKQSGFLHSIGQQFADGFNGWMLLLMVLGVVFLGSMHAFTPGHGKAILAAYLLGSARHKTQDILLLALVLTFTHTIVIYVLGAVLLIADQSYDVATMVPYFQKFGALLAGILAVSLIVRGVRRHRHHSHAHLPNNTSRWQVVTAAVSGGVVPCYEAFALFLLAVSAGYIAAGLLLVFTFSIGIALSILLLGILLLRGHAKLVNNPNIEKLATRYAPLGSGVTLLIIAVVLFLT